MRQYEAYSVLITDEKGKGEPAHCFTQKTLRPSMS